MKRINIQKDVESRRKIASTPRKPLVKPSKPVEDAKSEEIQGAEADTSSSTKPVQAPPKADRATKGNTKKV